MRKEPDRALHQLGTEVRMIEIRIEKLGKERRVSVWSSRGKAKMLPVDVIRQPVGENQRLGEDVRVFLSGYQPGKQLSLPL